MRGEGPPLTPALLWLTKPSAIFKQIPKPAPCVITAFTHAATLTKAMNLWHAFLGNAVHESHFTDAIHQRRLCQQAFWKLTHSWPFP